jgi:hypothetical protein
VSNIGMHGGDRHAADALRVGRACPPDCVEADPPSALPKIAAIDGIAIAEQMAWFFGSRAWLR